MEKLNMERTTKPASDLEIEIVSDEILALLKDFESPKDAGSAFALAHYKMTVASFPPTFRAQAIEAVDGHADTVKDLLNDGWQ